MTVIDEILEAVEAITITTDEMIVAAEARITIDKIDETILIAMTEEETDPIETVLVVAKTEEITAVDDVMIEITVVDATETDLVEPISKEQSFAPAKICYDTDGTRKVTSKSSRPKENGGIC